MSKMPILFKWCFAVFSVVFAVDRVLARFFEIGTADDSTFVIWCSLLTIWLCLEVVATSNTTDDPPASGTEAPTPTPPEDE